MNKERREAILREYGEVNSLFRMLTDIRFKLIGLLPVASVAAAALGQHDGRVPTAICVFGLAIVIGIITYNTRNDQLYNELVGRAATIERGLGLPDGAFCNRPRAWFSLRFGPWCWPIDHGTGITTVYMATLALWIYLTLTAILSFTATPALPLGIKSATETGAIINPRLATETSSPRAANAAISAAMKSVTPADGWIDIVAVGITMLVLWGGRSIIRRQRHAIDTELRRNVLTAIDLLASYENNLAKLQTNPQFLAACAAALDGKQTVVAGRAAFYGGLSPDALGYYALKGSPLHVTVSLISLLTDLPVHWAFDLAVNRKGVRRPCDWQSPLPQALRHTTLAAVTVGKKRDADD